MWNATWILKLLIHVSWSICDCNYISCKSDSTNAFSVKWIVTESDDYYYVVTWYSMDEYRSITRPNATYFRERFFDDYEDDISSAYLGMDYAQAFEEAAKGASIHSHGYIVTLKENSELIVTSRVLPNHTYDVTIRGKELTWNTTLLRCQVTTKAAAWHTDSTTISTSIESPATNNNSLDAMILYVVVPSTLMSLLTITLLGVMLTRNWRKKIFRKKTPVRVIASRDSDRNSEVTVSFGYSSDSRPSSSDSYMAWPRDTKVGSTAKNLKNRRTNRDSRYRHYVVTAPETCQPSPSPMLKPDDIEEDDSYDEDDPFDRLHHRHSLTTVTEESDSSEDAKRSGERYATFSARTFDSRLTSRECSFVTYTSNTPHLRGFTEKHLEHNCGVWTATKRENVWTSLSSHHTEDRLSRSGWHADNESDYSSRDTETPYSTKEYGHRRNGRRRPWIERRQRRVIPSLLHVKPLLFPTEDVLRTSEEGARLLGRPTNNQREKGLRRNPTPAIGVRRQGTPAVNQRNQFTYFSPHIRKEPPSTPRAGLRSTKSSRNILHL